MRVKSAELKDNFLFKALKKKWYWLHWNEQGTLEAFRSISQHWVCNNVSIPASSLHAFQVRCCIRFAFVQVHPSTRCTNLKINSDFYADLRQAFSAQQKHGAFLAVTAKFKYYFSYARRCGYWCANWRLIGFWCLSLNG